MSCQETWHCRPKSNQSKTRNIGTNIRTISDREIGSEVSLAERISRDVSFRLSSKLFKRQPDNVNGFLRKKVPSKAMRCGEIIAQFYVRDDVSQCTRGKKLRHGYKSERNKQQRRL